MLPGDTANSGEMSDSILPIYRYEYDYVVNGKTFHKSVDTNFIMKWNDSKTFIFPNFYIPPPWWKTGLLYIALFITCLVLSALLIRYYTIVKLRKQKRELEKQLAIQNERMRISSDMHDDLGAGLYGIKLQTEILSNKNLEPEIQNQFAQLHKSVSEISGKVREAIWSLNTENDSLLNLISFIHQQAHRMFANTEIDLTITSPENDLPVIINGETRRQIYLTIKEALNNVLKHSGAKSAKVSFTFSNHILQILIEDDGKEFNSASASVESMGLRTMKERVKLINGELDINYNSSGTKLNIKIPFR